VQDVTDKRCATLRRDDDAAQRYLATLSGTLLEPGSVTNGETT
jgi:hypothetical protein